MFTFDLSQCKGWSHHYAGWQSCLDALKPLHNPNGVLLVSSVESEIYDDTAITKPWVGFIHNVIDHPTILQSLYKAKYNLSLRSLLETEWWQKHYKLCRGVFCLSTESMQFLRQRLNIPVSLILHATKIPETQFNWTKFLKNDDKKVIMIGHWMRNFQDIYDLKTKYKKRILQGCEHTFNYTKIPLNYMTNDSVEYMDRRTNEEYDELLSCNLVFLSLYNSSANNAVIECIARGTPLFINRLPSLEEYLGKDYVLFYNTLEDVDTFTNDQLLQATYQLKANTYKISLENFYANFIKSEVCMAQKIFI